MIKNTNVSWIIKAHPANTVKNLRDNKINRSELDAIKEVVNTLPDHIQFVDAKDSTSTLSFFKSIDYCVTVRGTVGIEAACWGVPVLTAGSGRFDKIGFTIDHNSTQSYLKSLKKIEEIKRIDNKRKKLAIAFGYNLFCKRIFPTKNIKFIFRRNKECTMTFIVKSQKIFDEKNLISLAEWIENNNEDYFRE